MKLVIIMKYEIGKRIRSFREQANLSQKELASRIGVSNARLSNWEQGLNRPDADTIPAICEALSISPNDLLNTPTSNSPSPAALEFARRFERLDRHAQEVLLAVMCIEEKRCERDHVAHNYLKDDEKKIPIIGEIVADGSVEAKYAARKEVREINEELQPQ